MRVLWKVTTKQLHQWCSLKGGIASFESSAKEAINVEQAFQEAARKALAQEMQHDQYNDFPDQIQLNANTPSQQPREGCSCWVEDVSKIEKRSVHLCSNHKSWITKSSLDVEFLPHSYNYYL